MAKPSKTNATPTELAAVDTNTGEILDYGAYSDYADSGFENQGADDYSLPFMRILQALSPELETNDSLRPGMILNTVTGETFDGKKGISFIPASTKHEFVEWVPRDVGGGFVAAHSPTSELVTRVTGGGRAAGALKTPAGNDLIETFYVYGVVLTAEGSAVPAVISFESSKIKKYKGWMTKARSIQIQVSNNPPRRVVAPLFSHVYRLTTVVEKNKKGSFHNWEIGFDGDSAAACRLPTNHELFQAALKVRSMLDSGEAKVDYAAQGASGSDASVVDGEVAEGGRPVF